MQIKTKRYLLNILDWQKNSLILQSLCKDVKEISETLLMELKTYILYITVIPLLGR